MGAVANPTEILIVTGSPGSGKTSVAHSLATSVDRSVHVESDRFFGFIASGYIEPWKTAAHPQNHTVMEIVADVAVGYARAGYFTIIDGIVGPAWFFVPLCDAIQSRGLSVAYAVLQLPLSVAVKRAALREEGLSDPAVVEHLWNGFAELGDLQRHAIRSDTASVDVTARAVRDALSAGRLSVA